jgi:acyl carrier protein
MEDKIFAVLKEHLSLANDVDRTALKYNETPGWDSLAHMKIIAGLEEAFDCMLDTNDILDMSSFKVAITIMGKYK